MGLSRTRRVVLRVAVAATAVVVVAAGFLTWRARGALTPADLLLTPDQQGARLYRAGRYEEAASVFEDPYWKAAALYRAGKFKEAAGLYVGLQSPEADYDQGNARVMLGEYDEAVDLYTKALAARPGWEDAEINRRIAQIRAKRTEEKLGEGTGGKLPPDEVVFGRGKSASGGSETVIEQPSDAEIQATWLRRVATRPADFLRAKFAWQAAQHQDGKRETR